MKNIFRQLLITATFLSLTFMSNIAAAYITISMDVVPWGVMASTIVSTTTWQIGDNGLVYFEHSSDAQCVTNQRS